MPTSTVVEWARKKLCNERPPDPTLEVSFSLDLQKRNFSCFLHGHGVPVSIPKALEFQVEELQELIDLSEIVGELDKYPAWENQLRAVGNRLRKEIWENNAEVGTAVEVAAEKVGGIDHCRFCFNVEEGIYPLCLEAVTRPRDNFSWSMCRFIAGWR